MKQAHLQFLVIFSVIALALQQTTSNEWITEKHKGYNLLYTAVDRQNKDEYNKLIENGIVAVKSFFGSSHAKEFNIFIHPGRHSLDSTWQKDWNMPGFKSECWMVASGVASR